MSIISETIIRPSRPLYEFGRFGLDPTEEVLFCAGKPVRLTLKAFAVLRVLVENAGHVVTKDELIKEVWPDAVVEEANLAQAVSVLRKALGQGNASHHKHGAREYIETVARRGYRFVAPVTVHNEARGPIAVEGGEAGERSAKDMRVRSKPAKRYTESDEAHHLYQRGVYYSNLYTLEGLKKSIQHFRQALKIDPDYALAYYGLGKCYFSLSNMHSPPKKVMPKAKAALIRALRMDDTLAEAHSELGHVNLFYSHDWQGAEAEYKRAIELEPNCLANGRRYAGYLQLAGRFDEALSAYKALLDLEPVSRAQFDLGWFFHNARQYDAAVAQYQLAIDIEPDLFAPYAFLGLTYAQQRRFMKAIVELEKAASLADIPFTLGFLGYGYGVAGKRRQAMKVLAKLEQRAKGAYVSPFAKALVNIGLGQKEEALEALEKAYEARDDMLVLLGVSPELDSVRSEPRFVALLRRCQFPSVSGGSKAKGRRRRKAGTRHREKR